MTPDAVILATVFLTFLVAGFVKGLTGMGLPAIGVGLLTALIGLKPAMALVLVPAFATNVWQAFSGGGAAASARALWRFLVPATLFVFAGAALLSAVPVRALSFLLGILLAVYAVAGLSGYRLRLSKRQDRILAPVLGALNGLFSGMTGALSVPGVMYLQGRGLERNELIQAMGILFSLSSAALALALGRLGLLTWETGLISAAMLIPSLVGMALGQKVRHGMADAPFRRLFFLSLAALGGWIALKAALAGG